ncbi:MAG: hypothetical protein ABI759_22810 [Candidatus Solibacter sp.]
MKFNQTALRCVCVAAAMIGAAHGQTQIDLRTQGKNIDFSTAARTRPSKTGTLLPVTCAVGETFLKTDAAAGKNFHVCTAMNVWTVQGIEVPDPTGKANQALTTDGSSLSWQAFGGDVSGRTGALTVTGLGGRKLGSLVPLDGQFMRWNGIAQQWEPATLAAVLSVFGRTGAVTGQSGDYNFSQIAGTVGTWQLPSLAGDVGGTITGTTVTRLQSRPVSSATPLTGQVLVWDGAQWAPQASAGGLASIFGRTGAVTAQVGDYSFAQLSGVIATAQLPSAGGDLSGALATPTVAKLQGRTVSSSAPASGNVLTWNGSQWVPQAPTGAVLSIYGRTGAVTAQSGDYSFAQLSGTASSAQLPAAAGDVTGSLASNTVGKLQNRPMAAMAPAYGQVLAWDGAQWSPQTVSSGGGVSGVDKTASNTYAAGAKQTFVASLSTSGLNVTPGSLPTNPATGDISLDVDDANKLKVYDGGQWNTLVTVSNYVASFTSQTLVTINGTTHRLGTANVNVECYDSSSPSARVEPDKVVVTPVSFNVSIYFASPQTGTCMLSGTGGVTASGGGAGMASQLGDLGLVLTSPTVLTAGLNCSNATPCNARLGNTVYSVTSGSTVTLSAGSGTLFLYLDPAGTLIAGHNLTASCSGVCGALPGVTAFPAGSIPLYTWTATNGQWDTSGGSDKRAFLSTRSLGSGTGIVALDTGSQTIVSVDSASVPTYLTSTGLVDFGNIGAGACAELTLGLPGAMPGDSVAPGWPAALEPGLTGIMRISAANTAALRLCNLSGTAVDPAAATFRATVVRSF